MRETKGGRCVVRFINKWSYSCARSLAVAMNENHQKRSIYYYGFLVVFGAIVKEFLLLAVALILGVLIPTLIISLTFASLRKVAGGYHMDTYSKCLFVSLGIFILAALVAQHTYTYWSTLYLIVLIGITFFIGMYVLVRYAPRDTPNKPIEEPKEIRKFKCLSIIYIFLWTVITIILAICKNKLFVLSLCFGVLLEIFLISSTGHKVFDAIKYKLDRKKKTKCK
jgi:accessory gene regulator B